MAHVATFNAIYTLVKSIYQTVENLDELKEEGRKLYRYCKRAEVLVSDLQPYTNETTQIMGPLEGVECALLKIRNVLAECTNKGKMATYLQADILLDLFKESTVELDTAIGALQDLGVPLSEETQEEIETLRCMLQRATFKPVDRQVQAIEKFRDACERMRQPFEQLLLSCQDILGTLCGDGPLTKEEYQQVIDDLQREIKCWERMGLSSGREEYYLRCMMDLVRISHLHGGPPIEFVCPLTHQLMSDPVMLLETGHTYERRAIQEWFASGHKFCPKSGQQLKDKKLLLVPNQAIKGAIERWVEGQDMQLQFRPLMRTVSSSNKELRKLSENLSARVSFPQDDKDVLKDKLGTSPSAHSAAVQTELAAEGETSAAEEASPSVSQQEDSSAATASAAAEQVPAPAAPAAVEVA